MLNKTIAGVHSELVNDNAAHLPVFTSSQASSAVARVSRMTSVPVWYSGTLAQLRDHVYASVAKCYPDLSVNVPVNVSNISTASSLKSEPVDYSDIDSSQAKIIAGTLMDMLESRKKDVEDTIDFAAEVIKNGITGEQFQKLMYYMQEEIVYDLQHSCAGKFDELTNKRLAVKYTEDTSKTKKKKTEEK